MVTMIDEIFDRNYQSGRAALNDGIDRGLARLAASLAEGWTALNRIQFAAPWAAEAPRKDGRCA